MNFDWTKEFFSFEFESWDGSDFERYGLSESEVFYAWALTEVYDDIMEDINEYVLSGKQEFWQVNNARFAVKGERLIVSNPWEETTYELQLSTFKEHVEKILQARKSAL